MKRLSFALFKTGQQPFTANKRWGIYWDKYQYAIMLCCVIIHLSLKPRE